MRARRNLTMRNLPEKLSLLQANSCIYLDGLYYERKNKNIFSLEAIEQNSVVWLKARLSGKNEYWLFNTSKTIPMNVKVKILQRMGVYEQST